MSAPFKPGDKVVCIRPCLGLEPGQTYTIRVVGSHPLSPTGFSVGLEEEGTRCKCPTCAKHGNWEGSRFRKVQEKFTGMEVLRGLLKPTAKGYALLCQ